jgi:hypothetical protein
MRISTSPSILVMPPTAIFPVIAAPSRLSPRSRRLRHDHQPAAPRRQS